MVKTEDYEEGEALKKEGNEFFKNRDYKSALRCYSRVFGYIGMNGEIDMLKGLGVDSDQGNPDLKGVVSALRVKTFQNIMIIYSKWKNDEKILEKATKIIELTAKLEEGSPLVKQRVKALFFRAQVYRKTTDFENCERDLLEAKEKNTDPRTDKALDNEFTLLAKAKEHAEIQFEKKMRRAMKKNARRRREREEEEELDGKANEDVEKANEDVEMADKTQDADDAEMEDTGAQENAQEQTQDTEMEQDDAQNAQQLQQGDAQNAQQLQDIAQLIQTQDTEKEEDSAQNVQQLEDIAQLIQSQDANTAQNVLNLMQGESFL